MDAMGACFLDISSSWVMRKPLRKGMTCARHVQLSNFMFQWPALETRHSQTSNAQLAGCPLPPKKHCRLLIRDFDLDLMSLLEICFKIERYSCHVNLRSSGTYEKEGSSKLGWWGA